MSGTDNHLAAQGIEHRGFPSGTFKAQRSRGFSLMELMIAVAIIAILAAVSIPLYQGYVTTAREGVLVNSIGTIEMFQEDFRLRTGAYLTAAANAAAISAAIGWEPQGDDGATYAIAAAAGGSYSVTATDQTGYSVCITLPERVRC